MEGFQSFPLAQSSPSPNQQQPAQTQPQQPSSQSNIPEWLLIEVPLIGAIGVGAIIASIITAIAAIIVQKQKSNSERKIEQLRQQHDVEKSRRERRIQLIEDLRTLLNDEDLGFEDFRHSDPYHSVEEHLSDDIKEKLEKYSLALIDAYDDKCSNPQDTVKAEEYKRQKAYADVCFKFDLKPEIARLEKEWGLI